MNPKTLALLFVTLYQFYSGRSADCGWQAGGRLCPRNLCCSSFGFCGTSDVYCAAGCQSQCIRGRPITELCGKQAPNLHCPCGQCCSQYGYCGTTPDYCGKGCQAQCNRGCPQVSLDAISLSGEGVASIITITVFDQFLFRRNDTSCPAKGFYTYDAFLQAAADSSGFGTTGGVGTAKKELAAFFAQVAHETNGGCYKEQKDTTDSYCSPSKEWPCSAGKKYYGRGPLQITGNYNYEQVGEAIGFDAINHPELVATSPLISFKSAIWLWMKPQTPTTTSCHDAVVSNRGFGSTINILTGGAECGKERESAQDDRIKLYKSFCQTLGVEAEENLGC